MDKLKSAAAVGLKDNETEKLIAVYPYKAEGTDREIIDKVKSWYYKQSCIAEEDLRHAYVDAITESESQQFINSAGCQDNRPCER